MASSEKTRYKVVITDRMYTIIGQGSRQHMDLVIEIVNKQLAEIRHLSPQTGTKQASVLLTTNAVSDQLKRQEHALELKKQVTGLKQKTVRLAELENRVRRIEIIREKIQDVLKESGQEGVKTHSHMGTQQILNENRKRQIRDRGVSE